MKNNNSILFIAGALLAGPAIHWYVGGGGDTATTSRHLLVLIQLLVGVYLFYLGLKAPDFDNDDKA